jgi:transcriptional regulator with XRE-family HTH domain
MNERDRVLQVMQSEGMNAKQFCQEVGISQGTLSNIMGGRNKPSLDVMQAILRRFRAVSCDWLIMGVGTMYVSGAREEGMLPLFDDTQAEEAVASTANVMVEEKKPMMAVAASRTVSKIMVFYSDGTFEER